MKYGITATWYIPVVRIWTKRSVYWYCYENWIFKKDQQVAKLVICTKNLFKNEYLAQSHYFYFFPVLYSIKGKREEHFLLLYCKLLFQRIYV